MKLAKGFTLIKAGLVIASAFLITTAPVMAQDYPPPPSFSAGELDNLVSRIALYPDPLLAQLLAAASFPDQIAQAASVADQYRNLRGNDLANAISQANLQFDPAVQALIPFPSVLDMMAGDPNWTSALGNAVLANQGAVMDAVQRMRRSAEQYGYLRNNQQISVVDSGPGIEIEPVDPAFIYVPTYDPYVVFAPPRPGFFAGGAISFRFGYPTGAFAGWGWGGGFNWNNHVLLVNHAVWGRTWYNREDFDRRHESFSNGRVYAPHANGFTNGNRFGTTYSPAVRDNSRFGQTAPVAPARTYERNSFSAPREQARENGSNGIRFGTTYSQPPGRSRQWSLGQTAPVAPPPGLMNAIRSARRESRLGAYHNLTRISVAVRQRILVVASQDGGKHLTNPWIVERRALMPAVFFGQCVLLRLTGQSRRHSGAIGSRCETH